jgi:hypothetical protein
MMLGGFYPLTEIPVYHSWSRRQPDWVSKWSPRFVCRAAYISNNVRHEDTVSWITLLLTDHLVPRNLSNLSGLLQLTQASYLSYKNLVSNHD